MCHIVALSDTFLNYHQHGNKMVFYFEAIPHYCPIAAVNSTQQIMDYLLHFESLLKTQCSAYKMNLFIIKTKSSVGISGFCTESHRQGGHALRAER